MDVIKEKTNNYKPIILIVIIVGMLLALIWYNLSSKTQTIKKSDIIIGQVRKGDFQIEVQGYGKFISNKQKIITSLSDATVKEIIIKPGDKVKDDSVIAKLDNPELLQKYNNEAQELSQENANLRQLKLNHQRSLLNEEARLEDLIAEFKIAELYVVAHEKLVKSGTVSRITYESKKLQKELLERKLVIQKLRIKQLGLSNNEEINIQVEKIKQQEDILKIAKNRLDGLLVIAGMKGVMQKLSIELGQRVLQGSEVALIGSTEDLIALIRVPQIKADRVKIGQVVNIDIHQGIISGQVVRIDPRVENNTVSVEVEFEKQLPNSVRPEMNIEGTIVVELLKDVNYTDRPVAVNPNSNGVLFKVFDNQTWAKRENVQFGKASDKFIELLGQVNAGDEFILTDLSKLNISGFSIE